MKLKVIVTIFASILLVTFIALMMSGESETTKGVGLSVAAEKDLKTLKENAQLIIQGELDEGYEIETQVADYENDVYQIDRVYTVTVHQSLKGPNEHNYTKGDEIQVVYPVGFKQKNGGEFQEPLHPLSDEIIPLKSGEYLLFLDELKGDFYFSNHNHVYKKDYITNIKIYRVTVFRRLQSRT